MLGDGPQFPPVGISYWVFNLIKRDGMPQRWGVSLATFEAAYNRTKVDWPGSTVLQSRWLGVVDAQAS